ncbi:MAG: hypothetical protein IPL59_11420 [Candidatus Competibacteraceae bacterium]|nr:hypothetical protein [Candidatus Competibacteraceae bacterium]
MAKSPRWWSLTVPLSLSVKRVAAEGMFVGAADGSSGRSTAPGQQQGGGVGRLRSEECGRGIPWVGLRNRG